MFERTERGRAETGVDATNSSNGRIRTHHPEEGDVFAGKHKRRRALPLKRAEAQNVRFSRAKIDVVEFGGGRGGGEGGRRKCGIFNFRRESE